jgi:acyl-CoA synthetase (AMP-forming)/AMP-acid ligase II
MAVLDLSTQLDWNNRMNVADQLYKSALLYSDNIAARCDDETMTYAQLNERSNRLANALLANGLNQGDRVATWIENSIRCIEIDFALAKAGLIRVSLNPKLTPREATYIFQDSDAKCIIYGASFDQAIVESTQETPLVQIKIRAKETSPSDLEDSHNYESFLIAGESHAPGIVVDGEEIYCFFYTSGTTGKPKGVMLSHRSILQTSFNLLMELGPIAANEKILLMQPLSHGAGFFVLPQYMKGGCCIIMRHFDPVQLIDLAIKYQVEVIKLIPTMLQRILLLPDAKKIKLPHLRYMIYGASPMPNEPLKLAIEIFGPNKLVQIYGQSECPVTLSILPSEEHIANPPFPQRLLSAGRPWAPVEMRIVDDHMKDVEKGGIGELALKGPHMMSGYWKRDDLTQETIQNGWLKTKDMGRIDEHGFVYLLGRKDEMIISGGYNIAPREVEDILYQFPGVEQAAVIGEVDLEWGQAVVAYVVMNKAHLHQAKNLMDFGRQELGFKKPKRIYIVVELPKNAAGKIQKIALKPSMALEQIG